MSRSFHMAQSVDVDRFSDKHLRERVCPFLLKEDGSQPTPGELRIACHNARLAGMEVLPPCDNTMPNGRCAGHPPAVSDDDIIDLAAYRERRGMPRVVEGG